MLLTYSWQAPEWLGESILIGAMLGMIIFGGLLAAQKPGQTVTA